MIPFHLTEYATYVQGIIFERNESSTKAIKPYEWQRGGFNTSTNNTIVHDPNCPGG